MRRIAVEARPLQHPERRYLPVVAERLQRHRCPHGRSTAVPYTCFRFSSLGRDPCSISRYRRARTSRTLAEPVNVARPFCSRPPSLPGHRANPRSQPLRHQLRSGQHLRRLYQRDRWCRHPRFRSANLCGQRRTVRSSAARGPRLRRRRSIPNWAASPCRRPPDEPVVQVSYHYGFNADMGGGEYPRSASFAGSPEQVVVRVPAGATYPLKHIQQALHSRLPRRRHRGDHGHGRYSESGGLDRRRQSARSFRTQGRRPAPSTLVIGDASPSLEARRASSI